MEVEVQSRGERGRTLTPTVALSWHFQRGQTYPSACPFSFNAIIISFISVLGIVIKQTPVVCNQQAKGGVLKISFCSLKRFQFQFGAKSDHYNK